MALLGQGCWTIPNPQPSPSVIPSVSGDPSPDGPVTFREGFGKLPGTAPTRPGVPSGSLPIVFATEVPELPPEVTVLREWASTPDETLIRNITTALHIPSGALGRTPIGKKLELTWKDGAGYIWSYASASNTVTFAATRDAQSAIESSGQPMVAATLEADVTGDIAIRGFFESLKNMDRSNYPALSAGDVLERLRAGGTHPVTDAGVGSSVVFDRLSIALVRHEADADGASRVFYLPALWAQGTLRRADGAIIPWATTVPLVSDESFQGK